ncbi:MAG TPA: alpha,alpha-trehalose-phosphate synthase (UDP-forming) [Nevskia sp.]|jgi:trehalose 6-phosphate synthase|nr:alpha,alpha-trehalose-phosphate synthase (UDP-forming) [Nevskia sp.]
MSRIVAVSNRVGPIRGAARAGGLAVALIEALRQSKGLWFGWSGRTADAEGSARLDRAGPFEVATINLTRAEHEDYYNGFANQCLWPLFHYRIDLTTYDRQFYEGYQRVNVRFARALQPLLRDDDRIWVHDYHLIPCGQSLRDMGCRQPMGFFLHIPFPSREVLLTLPHHEQLIRSLLAYDLVGFQTQRDCERFFDYAANEIPGAEVRGNLLRAGGRQVRVEAFPIGIDAQAYAGFVDTEDGQRQWLRARNALRGRLQIIGVDRLDYTKGIPERFAAYERLLADYPDCIGRVEYLQIAPPTREGVPEYDLIRQRLEQAASQINGRYGEVDWTPLRYIHRTLSRRALAGLYRASKIGLVTPLRDGMNLIAKEYVAAQDPQDPGVLVLSRFAGAAAQMGAALIVNPYDTVGVAEALQTARYMSLEERRNRHTELMEGLLREDISHWRERFVSELRAAAIRQAA